VPLRASAALLLALASPASAQEVEGEAHDLVLVPTDELFDAGLRDRVKEMMEEAVACETQFAEDLLSGGVPGMSVADMRRYLEYVADQRLRRLGMEPLV
jgi:ribonucleoside-diphosphate reductase beta chain